MRSLGLLAALAWAAAAAPSSINGRAPGLQLGADFVERRATISDGNTTPRQKRAISLHDCGGGNEEEVNSALEICATRAAAAEKVANDPKSDLVQRFFKDGSNNTRNGVAEVFKRIASECGSAAKRNTTITCTKESEHCQEQYAALTTKTQGPAPKPELENPMVNSTNPDPDNGDSGMPPGNAGPGMPPGKAGPGVPPGNAVPGTTPGTSPGNADPGMLSGILGGTLKARGPAPQDQELDMNSIENLIQANPNAGPIKNDPNAGPIPITLCPGFFSMERDLTASNSQGSCGIVDKPGVMIHEMSHALANCEDLSGYGTEVIASLRSNENKIHADTFSAFSLAAVLNCSGPQAGIGGGGVQRPIRRRVWTIS